MTPPRIWYVASPTDDYFCGVVLAASEDEARSLAWEEFRRSRTGKGEDPDLVPEGEGWRAYHDHPSELVVRDLGTSYFGSDGSGRIEVDL